MNRVVKAINTIRSTRRGCDGKVWQGVAIMHARHDLARLTALAVEEADRTPLRSQPEPEKGGPTLKIDDAEDV